MTAKSYQSKLRRHGLKQCCRCLGEFPFTRFRRTPKGVLAHKCSDCEVAASVQSVVGRKAYYEANKDWIRERGVEQRLRSRYGVDLEWFESKLEEQGGVCKICGKTNDSGKRLHVDHDHQTGKVRGLLCFRCNHRLGVLENREWVEAALAYLVEHEELNG